MTLPTLKPLYIPYTRPSQPETRNLRTTYCARHSVMLPEEIFETKKYLVTNFPGKVEKNAKPNVKTYGLFIYEYIHHIGS